ncbi:MAG: AraC family transcriptional regulator [Anaerolineae bacterium]|nr:AraC family transcriptional regulator [Anaerolineae bacterium]MDW8171198.1 helix-turn-helix transcriptional regulator [Anaerolineae bacterium]
MELRAATIIDSEIQGHYAFFPFVQQISTREHRHDFYEVFLIVSGMVNHHINGNTEQLSQGCLVFIRPDDRHYFSGVTDHNCRLINLAFARSLFDDLAAFLGPQVVQSSLLQSDQPPTVWLSSTERSQLADEFQRWGKQLYRPKAESRLELRVMLAGVLTRYYLNNARSTSKLRPAPDWLTEICQKMYEEKHFIEGRAALMRLANRSPEYVNRTFRLYLNMTPSEFINGLRLDYAAELLLQTQRSVIDICFETGFGNLSHFYHRFKERWGCSPEQFRKTRRDPLVP